MRRRPAPKDRPLRRLATLVAAIGVLVTSSGLALMVTASPATAANKVGICHATGSDSNPYTFISVDDDSVKLKGHLEHRNNPNKTWNNAGTFNGVPHAAGAPKPDLIGSFTDDQGVFHLYDGNITAASCESSAPVVEATADVDFFDPSCANRNVVSYDTTGSHVSFAVTSGSATPGSAIQITATADPGTQFAGGATQQVFNHVYPGPVDLNAPPCSTADATATVTFVDPTCANANEASYATSGENVTFAVTSGSAAPGATIQVTATATAGHTFGNLTTKRVFTHTFGDALNLNGPPCVVVGPPDPADATAGVTFVDPSCANLNAASYDTSGNHVTFAVTSGSAAPGATIEVTATVAAGHTFADLTTTKVFTHTFDDAVDLNGAPCVVVNPPVVNPPVVNPPVVNPPEVLPPAVNPPEVLPPVSFPPITPTVVHSGLVTSDLQDHRGLAVVSTGLLLLLLAGGLSLVRPTAAARS